MDNAAIAEAFAQLADLLEGQGANAFRVRAYRRGAEVVRSYPKRLTEVLEAGGRSALVAIPGIGEGLAAAIDELVHTGQLSLLRRLQGQSASEDLLADIPGIGSELAHRIHDSLHIDSLEQLEIAAYDGRLAEVDGIGEERLEAIRDHLHQVLDRSARRRSRARQLSLSDVGPTIDFDHQSHPLPDVDLLLSIDAEYRRLAEQGRLERIAPTRMNPKGERWLPVWHPEREGHAFTVMFSNTARAHRLGKTHDWVVIYHQREGEEEQCTVVTEQAGALAGLRVVRGREDECRAYYAARPVADEVRSWATDQAERLSARPRARLIDDVRGEVRRLHRFFEDWFAGDVDDTDQVFAAAADFIAPGFVLIGPRAILEERDSLLAAIRRGHGSRRNLRIWIDDLRLHWHKDDMVLVTYQEWQSTGPGPGHGRISTALLRFTDDQPRRFHWLHVHETAMPSD